MDIQQELKDLKTAVASAQSAYTAKASPQDGDAAYQSMCYRMDALASYIDRVYSYASRVEDALYNHANSSTHIPPIQGAGKMQKALKALGIEDDYDIQKRTIFASKDGYKLNFTIGK